MDGGGFLEKMFKHDGFFPIFIINKDKKEEEIKDIQVNTFTSKIKINGVNEPVDYTPNNLIKIVDEYKKNENLYIEDINEKKKNRELYNKMLETIDLYNLEKNKNLQTGGKNKNLQIGGQIIS